MVIPYFLTRQSANLMEDFVREIERGSALYLLYGVSGVGKTRLLQELSRNRLSDRRVHWLDLAPGETSDGAATDFSRGIEELFESAEAGDVIIADHFELALKKNRHQLFLSWSTDGVDRGLNLIIASSNEGFNDIRQLSQQYRARVQSFQLMPFSRDEIDAFIAFSLFPNQSADDLGIPAPLRKRIASTQGVVGRVIEIIERDSGQISVASATDSGSMRRGVRVIAALLGLFTLGSVVGWYVLGERSEFVAPQAARESNPVIEAVAAAAGEAVAPLTPQDESRTDESQSDESQSDESQSDESHAIVDEAAQGAIMQPVEEIGTTDALLPDSGTGDAADEQAAEDPVAANSGSVSSDRSATPPGSGEQAAQSTPAINTASGVDAQNDAQQTPAPGSLTREERFLRDLEIATQWIRDREDGVGTIQIMLISVENFDLDAYYDFVERLEDRQIDTGKIRVFKTLTGRLEMYSVFYGEYDSRKNAIGEIRSLPPALRDVGPIARSVGGIRAEIRRLDAQS